MGPDLRQLRYFLALEEERSFTRAAQRLRLTQQALSLAVRQLEQRVGTEVVVRRPGGVELTAAGATLVEHARETVASADRLQAAMDKHRDGRRGRLRVGLLMDGAGLLTAPILAAFRDARPAVELAARPRPHPPRPLRVDLRDSGSKRRESGRYALDVVGSARARLLLRAQEQA